MLQCATSRVAGRAIAVVLALASGAFAQTNRIVAENALPGNPASEWDITGDGDLGIQGFATEMSVNHGETVVFKVNTAATAYRIDIYRMGYYGGLGARHVATIRPSAPLPQSQPPCLWQPSTRLTDCGNWDESASWAVPADAVSGIYIAKLVREDPEDGRASHILFVVRDDDGQSQLLFQTSDATWQAYNRYNDYNFYSAPRSYKVSYNRPMKLRGIQPWDFAFNAEYPMVRWLERNGYDVSYFTDLDSDRRGGEILEHRVFLSVGHDEYWSRGQRDAVEAARAAGINLAFFSGNEIYWKTRWEPSTDASATPYRTLVCYKESQNDAKIDPLPNVWTGWWRDCRFSPPADGCEPENALSGQIGWSVASCDARTCGIQVPDTYKAMRLWRNTDIAALPPGQSVTLPAGTLGHEWDFQQFDASNPPGLVWLSSTTVSGVTHHLSLYRHPSGALVFGAGTIQWVWGLDDHHTNEHLQPIAGEPPDPRMQQATVNLLAEMGAQPRTLQADLTPVTATGDVTPPVSIILSPATGDSLLSGPVVVHGTATDATGVVGVVEVSADGGATWSRASGGENWSFTWSAPAHAGPVTLRSRAADDWGNLETPGPGVAVEVGGPPIEVTSVGAGNVVYQNGADTATLTIVTQSNRFAQDSLEVHLSLNSNLGAQFDVGRDAFAVSALGSHTSTFAWPLPAAGFPREFAMQVELSRAGQLLGTYASPAAFCGMVMSHAELQQATNALIGPSGCLAPATECAQDFVNVVPYFGPIASFEASLPAFCRTRPELAAGRPANAGAYGIAGLLGAIDPVLAVLSGAKDPNECIPKAVQGALACSRSLVGQGLKGGGVDALVAIVQPAFADAGRRYSNEFFVQGPAALRIGRDGHWTSLGGLALRDAYVFDIGDPGIEWGHAGPAPVPLGSTATNPEALCDVQLRAYASGTVEFGFLHRADPDSILWIRYAPIAVTTSTVAHAALTDDLTYPWGFALYLDLQGDGIVDRVLFPEGRVLSDATPAPDLRFRVLPNQPNPFNPTTSIRYVLPASGMVTVTVLDVRGRLLATLANGIQGPGLQSRRWNGEIRSGRRAPSGTYFVRVESPWGTVTRKLTLLK